MKILCVSTFYLTHLVSLSLLTYTSGELERHIAFLNPQLMIPQYEIYLGKECISL